MKSLARPTDTDEIRTRLRTVRPDSPRLWGRMSAPQMVCHLADSFRMATGERAVTARPGLLGRTVVKWVALSVPLRWPRGRIATVAEVDPERGGTPPAEFDADVARLESLLEAFVAHPRVEHVPHPVFGRMTRAEWLRWAYLHADHHLRQFGA